MDKILVGIFLGLCLFSCERSAPHVEAGQAFIKKYSREVQASEGWILIGSGGGFHNNISELYFHFICFDQLNFEEIREVMVQNIAFLSEKINSDQSLMPYLHETPFRIKDISLLIGFHKKNSTWKSLDPPYIAFATLVAGNIGYAIYDDCKGNLKIIHRETYEEACEIVRHPHQGPALCPERIGKADR